MQYKKKIQISLMSFGYVSSLPVGLYVQQLQRAYMGAKNIRVTISEPINILFSFMKKLQHK